MQQRILFLTTANLATNPRLVKEIRTCLELGHRVTVISFCFQNWSKPLNDALLNELWEKAELITVPGDKTKFTPWILSSLVSILSRLLLHLAPENLYFRSFAMFKRSWLLWQTGRKFTGSFDLVIAHNPGAFVPALTFGRRKHARIGIDIEDYHPGESNDAVVNRNVAMMMKKVLSNADVITAASPLILEHSLVLNARHDNVRTHISNAFSVRQQPTFKHIAVSPLKAIWFSQTVGLNRGVQDMIQAMNRIIEFPIQLTILGNCSNDTQAALQKALLRKKHSIMFLPPVDENSLIAICSQHHIGLTLEKTDLLNRDLCLTNKLFTYLLAGNAIIATDTTAQKQFLAENSGVGEIYAAENPEQLVKVLERMSNAPACLLAKRKRAYELANTTLNWENESQKFIKAYNLN